MGRSIVVFIVMSVFMMMLSGCGKKEMDEPTKYQSQAGLEKLTKQAQQKAAQQKSGSADNPKFSSFSGKAASSDAAKDLDSAIRPVLVQLFGDARLIEEVNKPVTQRDGEVVLNSLKYTVRRILDGPGTEKLHATLINQAHFSTSPRLGSKPTTTSQWGLMSLFKSTSRGTYSLEIAIDFIKQVITVKSYQLGSKYDRLM